MQKSTSVDTLRNILLGVRFNGQRIGFVPTMGALHDGHLSLIQKARESGADFVVVSIFVNPTQFNQKSDLLTYPRDELADQQKLKSAGCDLLFMPTENIMYPPGFQSIVEVQDVSTGLCGANRPGHFQGVCTVVLKLLNLVQPDLAVFGEKDFQQLTVLRTLVRDLNVNVQIIGAPLLREADGMAMSSRNQKLSTQERHRALAISKGLLSALDAYQNGARQAQELFQKVRVCLDRENLEAEYLELRSFVELKPLDIAVGPCVILIAVVVGTTRLIDNVILERP